LTASRRASCVIFAKTSVGGDGVTQEEEHIRIQTVLAGDPDAFESLVEENQKTVYNMALRMTGNREDALDISQDVFLKAYSCLSTFRGDCRFSSFLYRLTYNMCIDLSRKKKREKVIPLVQTGDDGDEAEWEIPDPAPLPEEEIQRKELQKAVTDAMDTMSPEHRRMIVLRELSGMSYEEIGDLLNLNSGTVKSRLARARKKLADVLAKNGTFSPNTRQENRKEAEAHDDL